MTEEGYSKGQSDNLLFVDMFMVARFINTSESFSLGEVRGVKVNKSGRESYGDTAVGWVQVKRNDNVCIVKAKITPEHNAKKKQYAVTCYINEQSREVTDVQCHDCAASLGGCKHAIAFLMWLHRRSEEPSKTDVTCYWAKSKLSKVGTSLKYLTLKDFGAKDDLSSDEDSSNFFQEVIEVGIKNNSDSQLLRYFEREGLATNLGIYQLMLKFISTGQSSYSEFIHFCCHIMTKDQCAEAVVKTVSQSDNSLWFDLRYGRITASKLYDAAHCKKNDGVFVQQILGVSKFKATSAMNRGKHLKASIIKCLEKSLKIKFNRIGLQLNPKYPIFGASPDAICEEYVVEIKCPQYNKNVKNYLTKGNELTAKYNAQVQLQMLMLNKKKCLFCIADQDFERNSKFNFTWIEYDEEYLDSLMTAAQDFWCNIIFPQLFKSL